MLNLLGLNKWWLAGIAAAIIIGIGGIAIYTWRADIKQAVYDEIFRDMAKTELEEKDKEIDRLNRAATVREATVVRVQEEKRKEQAKVEALSALIRGQSFSKEPVSPGLTKALEAIQDFGRKEEAK